MASKQTGHFLSVIVGTGKEGGSEGIITMGPGGFSVFLRLVGSETVFTTVTSSLSIKLFPEVRKFLFLGWIGEEIICRAGCGGGSGVVKPLSAKVLNMAISEDELVASEETVE